MSSLVIGRQVGQELAPILGAGLGAGSATDPFLSVFGLDNFPAPKDSVGVKALTENQLAKSLTDAIFNLVKPKPKLATTSAPNPAPSGGGNVPSKNASPSDFVPNKQPQKKVTARDFLRPAKIAATGAAVTAAGLGVNEAAKELGGTLNDALDTTGKAIQNASEGIGKGADALAESVGQSLKPLLDPLGVTDPQTQKNIGGLVLAVGVISVAALTLYFVMGRK